MHGTHARSMYTGFAAAPMGYGGHHHGVAGHGFCAGCGHPRSACCCGCRECRKEARDLLVEPTLKRGDVRGDPTLASAASRMSVLHPFAAAMEEERLEKEEARAEHVAVPSQWLTADALRAGRLGLGTAFIGGGCCVHLSIEYSPTGAADGIVGVHVQDSYDTQLTWIKKAAAGLGYQIKEGIVTTKPGAHLTALAVGATARVRWCEVFSC
jgi:hypothetical protein